jgi:ABC-2 type transport system ATP-binding protein
MIQASGLSKTFRGQRNEVQAVRGVDLHVQPGEIVGFLGPNGAGKTTTQRMLCTLLEPTSGNAVVAGHDLRRDPLAVRRAIGYVAQGGQTEPVAKVKEELVDHARMFGISRLQASARADALLAQMDLPGTAERLTKTLSGGQRRRLDIALGLVHEPQLVFLDEPTSGLDPQARANLWEHIRALRDDRGTTVFLTTHYLEEADALCDRILVIDDGEIVAEGEPEELKRSISGDQVVATAQPGETAAVAAIIGGLRDVSEPVIDGEVVRFTITSAAVGLPAVFSALDQAALMLAGVEVHRPTLDDVFLTLTGRALRDEQTATLEAVR